MRKLLNLFKTEISAVAAIEFAILLPLLLLLFFGSFEVSRYVIVTRKADNVANDIGYILSREGDIHDADGDNNDGEDGEDADRLSSLIRALVPMILYPYENTNYEIGVKFIGLPINNTPGFDPDSLRVMWAHCEEKAPGSELFRNGCDNGGVAIENPRAYQISNATKNISGETYDTSAYSDSFGERANIILRGQSFILVNFIYGYDQVLTNFTQFGGIDFTNFKLEKVSTYAVRSRWDDKPVGNTGVGNGRMEPDEFLNNMHICLDCNVYRSDELTSGDGREQCESDETIDDGDNARQSDSEKASGCAFN